MEIKTYTIKDLKGILDDEVFWNADVLPITKHKAISYLNNPRAGDTDMALVVAYEGDRVIGYQGMLPDLIFLDGKEQKFAWGSSWWVDMPYWGKGIGEKLKEVMYAHYDFNVGSRAFSATAKKTNMKMDQLVTLREEHGLSVGFYFNLNWNGMHRTTASFLKLRGLVVNGYMRRRKAAWKRRNDLRGKVSLEYLTEIDRPTKEFMAKYQARELTRRGEHELNWILKYPWAINAPLRETTEPRYYFPCVSKQIFNLAVKILDHHERIIGFVVMHIRNRKLKVPYAYYDEENLHHIMNVIAHHIIEMKIREWEAFNPDFVDGMSGVRDICVATRKIKRETAIAKKFQGFRLDDLRLQDGDGDCAFW